jgi:hypothetical protein
MNDVDPPDGVQIARQVIDHLLIIQEKYRPAALTGPKLSVLEKGLTDLLLSELVKRVIYGFKQQEPVEAFGGGLPLAAVWVWRIERMGVAPEVKTPLLPDKPFWAGWPFVLRVQVNETWSSLQPEERETFVTGGQLKWLAGPPGALLLLEQPQAEWAQVLPRRGLVVLREHYHIME